MDAVVAPFDRVEMVGNMVSVCTALEQKIWNDALVELVDATLWSRLKFASDGVKRWLALAAPTAEPVLGAVRGVGSVGWGCGCGE